MPKFKGKPAYLFEAIDRCTRAIVYWVYEQKNAENTEDFMDKCFTVFTFKVTHILTDNGLEFTNRRLVSKKKENCAKLSKMDVKCREMGIDHRLVTPCTTKTIGIVERVNGTLKSNTILINKYENKLEMNQNLVHF